MPRFLHRYIDRHWVVLEMMTDCSTASAHSASHCRYPAHCNNEARHSAVHTFWVACRRCITWCLWFNSPPHFTSLAFFLHLLGSDWKEGAASQALPFSIRSKSCPKKCSLGPRHDEERYRVFGGSFPQFPCTALCFWPHLTWNLWIRRFWGGLLVMSCVSCVSVFCVCVCVCVFFWLCQDFRRLSKEPQRTSWSWWQIGD